MSSDVVRSAHHVTKHYTRIHNILSTAPQLSISQKALGTLPENGNVMPKHVIVLLANFFPSLSTPVLSYQTRCKTKIMNLHTHTHAYTYIGLEKYANLEL